MHNCQGHTSLNTLILWCLISTVVEALVYRLIHFIHSIVILWSVDTGNEFSFTDNLSYYRPYNCGCGKCTIQSILENACLTPLTSDQLPIFSFNPAHKLAGKVDANKVWLLERKTNDISSMFKDTLYETLQQLQANRVSISRIVSVVRYYCEEPNTGSTFECDCDNYDELLLFLRDKVSWFQHDIMSTIVNRLLKDNAEVKELWRKYSNELKKYGENRVEEYEGVEFGLPPTDEHKILWMALDPGLNKIIKLRDIPALRDAFCEVFGCSNVVLYFYTARHSSVILEFVITLSAYKKIFPLSQDQIQQLAKLDIISLHIEDTDVFPQTAEWISLMGGKDVTLCKSIYMHTQN